MDTYARAFPAFPAFQQVLMLPPDDVSNFQAKFARIWWSVHYRYILLHIKSFPNFKSIRRVCYFVSFLYQVACTLGALRTERAGLGPRAARTIWAQNIDLDNDWIVDPVFSAKVSYVPNIISVLLCLQIRRANMGFTCQRVRKCWRDSLSIQKHSRKLTNEMQIRGKKLCTYAVQLQM